MSFVLKSLSRSLESQALPVLPVALRVQWVLPALKGQSDLKVKRVPLDHQGQTLQSRDLLETMVLKAPKDRRALKVQRGRLALTVQFQGLPATLERKGLPETMGRKAYRVSKDLKGLKANLELLALGLSLAALPVMCSPRLLQLTTTWFGIRLPLEVEGVSIKARLICCTSTLQATSWRERSHS